MPPAAVNVVTLQSSPLMLTTELTGRSAPLRVAEVRPQVSGIILKHKCEGNILRQHGTINLLVTQGATDFSGIELAPSLTLSALDTIDLT